MKNIIINACIVTTFIIAVFIFVQYLRIAEINDIIEAALHHKTAIHDDVSRVQK